MTISASAGRLVKLFEGDDAAIELVSAMRRARSWVRLVTRIVPAPCCTRWRAASSLILPAPTRNTVRPWSEPKILRARSTATEAMETEFEPISVSVRTFLAAAKALCSRCSSWPPTVPAAAGHGEGLFHLAENLRLAYHHGVQAGGHAEEVPDCLAGRGARKDVRREHRWIEPEVVRRGIR